MTSPRRKFLRQAALAGSILWLPKLSFGKPIATSLRFVLLQGGIRPIDVQEVLGHLPEGALRNAGVKLLTLDDPEISHQNGMAYFRHLPFQNIQSMGEGATGAYVINGFDCAHFNGDLYRKKLSDAFTFLHEQIISSDRSVEWIICSEIGRNRETNGVHDHPSLSGFDHHLPEARTTFCIQLQSGSETLPGHVSMRRLSRYLGTRFQLA